MMFAGGEWHEYHECDFSWLSLKQKMGRCLDTDMGIHGQHPLVVTAGGNGNSNRLCRWFICFWFLLVGRVEGWPPSLSVFLCTFGS
jgi:hypothetical protein